MKKAFLSILIIAGMIVVQPIAAQADGYYKGACKKWEEKAKTDKIVKLKSKVKLLWKNQEDLKITAEQMEKIKDIKHKAIKQLIQSQADKEIVMVDLESKMKDDVIDAGAVNPLIDAKYAAKARTAKTYTKAISDIQQVLTEKQRDQWNELSKESQYSRQGGGQCSECMAKGSMCSRCAAKKDKMRPITGKMMMKDK